MCKTEITHLDVKVNAFWVFFLWTSLQFIFILYRKKQIVHQRLVNRKLIKLQPISFAKNFAKKFSWWRRLTMFYSRLTNSTLVMVTQQTRFNKQEPPKSPWPSYRAKYNNFYYVGRGSPKNHSCVVLLNRT